MEQNLLKFLSRYSCEVKVVVKYSDVGIYYTSMSKMHNKVHFKSKHTTHISYMYNINIHQFISKFILQV